VIDDDPRGESPLCAVRRRPFALDLTRPLGTAHGAIRRREGFLIAVERGSDGDSAGGDGGGAVGLGEATPLPGWTESREACAAAIDEVDVQNGSASAPAAFDAASTPAARHGVSLALADAATRAAAIDANTQVVVRAPVTDHRALAAGVVAPLVTGGTVVLDRDPRTGSDSIADDPARGDLAIVTDEAITPPEPNQLVVDAVSELSSTHD